jgi:2-iminobutanoate/2-iminopropanoate deaminase
MLRHVVSDPGLPPSIGPYSHAVQAGGFVFVAGQPGLDPATGNVPGETFEEEARQAFTNLATVLRLSGSDAAHVVSTTVLVSDVADFAAMNAAFAEAFPTGPPTRMTMQVPLPRGLRISIGCVAVLVT